jgi:hypothetical protein
MDRFIRPAAALLLCIGFLTAGALLYARPAEHQASALFAQTSGSFADPAFQQVWERTDKPVQDGTVTDRSWTWGPTGFFSTQEPYVEAANGQLLVQYFDKSRMEVSDPNGDRSSPWFVTNGLLVTEMMSGKIAKGTNSFTETIPAQVPVAGDTSASVNAPTYASLAKVASLNSNNRAVDRTGQVVDQGLDKDANVISSAKFKEYAGTVVYSVYEPTLGHNIPNVFWTFMNQSGLVYENGQLVTGKIVDWVFAMGYPLTEPYWVSINVGGKDIWVLMQAFQRRILTYNPSNDPSFQVEMGNVGRSYYDWRYNQQGQVIPSATAAVPTTTGTPAPAATVNPVIAVEPETGNINTTLKVSGEGYPPNAAVIIGVNVPGTDSQRGLTTAAADPTGKFIAYISLPDEYAKSADLTIYAAANDGAVVATDVYVIAHQPNISVSPPETTNTGVIEVAGGDFPANSQIALTAKDARSGSVVASSTVIADSAGAFDVTYTLAGRVPVGGQYVIVATGPNNLTAEAQTNLKIVQQPAAVVQPNRGPVGVSVIFSGSKWQPNRLLSITLEGENGQTLLPLPPVVTDGAGNFAAQVLIPADYAGQTQVTLVATDDTSRITIRAPYAIVQAAPTPVPVLPTPTSVPPVVPPTSPAAPSPTTAAVSTATSVATAAATSTQAAPTTLARISVTPNPVAIGQTVTVSGDGFPAGSTVEISIAPGSTATVTPIASVTPPAGKPVASVQTDRAGTFTAQFVLDNTQGNEGTILVIARGINGAVATAPLTITASGGTPGPSPRAASSAP